MFRPFPIKTYAELTNSFYRTSRSILAAIDSTRAIRQAMDDMVLHQEDVTAYLRAFSFINQILLRVSDKAISALQLSSAGFHR
jgi:hypothetical protein